MPSTLPKIMMAVDRREGGHPVRGSLPIIMTDFSGITGVHTELAFLPKIKVAVARRGGCYYVPGRLLIYVMAVARTGAGHPATAIIPIIIIMAVVGRGGVQNGPAIQ